MRPWLEAQQYQISFVYSYLDINKKATEIWTNKDDKVYTIDYLANEQVMI